MRGGNGRVVALAIALVIVVIALVLRYSRSDTASVDTYVGGEPQLGEAGSEHTHMSMLVFVSGKLLDFSQPLYQLQNELVHFEDADGIFIHKHATGVTLTYLFESLEMELTSDCIRLRTGLEYCSDGKAKLQTYLNKEKFGDWDKYELRDGDKILIDYGNTSEFDHKLLLNTVPDLTPELLIN
ncbi:MAG TPA: protein-disulfide isomerase [Candidatus Paceibacterota bacterium]